MAETKTFTFRTNFGNLLIHYITDSAAAVAACARLSTEKVIGFDVETDKAEGFKDDKQAGLDPYRSKVRLIQFGREITPAVAGLDGEMFLIDNFFIDDTARAAVRDLLELERPVKVGQNIKFDVKMARHHFGVRLFGKLFDTRMASQLIKCGTQFKGFDLQTMVSEYLNEWLSKEMQRSNWGELVLTDQQLKYAALDAFTVLLLRRVMLRHLKEMDLLRAAALEFDAVDPVCALELNGLPVVPERWLDVEVEMTKRFKAITEEIYEWLAGDESVATTMNLFDFAAPVKIRSTEVIKDLLIEMGIELPDAKETKAQKKKREAKEALAREAGLDIPDRKAKSTRNWQIKPLAERYKFIDLLITWRELSKRTKSYGSAFLRNVNPVTGRIHAKFDPLRAKTSRFGNSSPNLQQIPRLQDYRSCFAVPGHPAIAQATVEKPPRLSDKTEMKLETITKASELKCERVFVQADYGQIELRLAAAFSGDPGFIAAFLSGRDFHEETCIQMFKLTPGTPEVKEKRAYAKNINFGIIYGVGAGRVAMQTGLTLAEAKEVLKKYREAFPELIAYLDRCAAETVANKQIRTWSGYIAKFPFDDDDGEARSQAERNGKNTPIQGGSANMLKMALRFLHDEMMAYCALHGDDAIKLVHIIHDEIILEAHRDHAEAAGEMLVRCMKRAGDMILCGVVPCVVDAKLMTEWVKD
jgi:DNA polymerase-1